LYERISAVAKALADKEPSTNFLLGLSISEKLVLGSSAMQLTFTIAR